MPPVIAAVGAAATAIGGAVVAGGAAVVAGATAVAGAVSAVAATTVVGGITIGSIAYTAATAYAINAMSKKSLAKARSAAASIAAAQKGYGTNVNAVSPASNHAIIYGTQRVGGVIFYRSITNDQQYLHTLIALAGHECEEIGTVYADNVALTLDGDGFVTNDDFQIKDADGNVVNSALRINKHLGTSTQALMLIWWLKIVHGLQAIRQKVLPIFILGLNLVATYSLKACRHSARL